MRQEEPEKKARIWQVVNQIPEGKVASYGQVARLADLPGYARYVGHVMKNLPPKSRIPWFRVLRSGGRIAFPKQSEAWKRQKALLEQEAVKVSDGRVSMGRHQWQP